MRRLISIGIALLAAVPAAAQPPAHDLTDLPSNHPTVYVVDDAGQETSGRLVRFSADSVTLSRDGSETTIERQRVARIYKRDSLKNGVLIGALSGAALGAALGPQVPCGPAYAVDRSCSTGRRIGYIAQGAGVIGGIGAVLGAGVDAMVKGRSLIYEERSRRPNAAFVVAPPIRRTAGVSLVVRW